MDGRAYHPIGRGRARAGATEKGGGPHAAGGRLGGTRLRVRHAVASPETGSTTTTCGAEPRRARRAPDHGRHRTARAPTLRPESRIVKRPGRGGGLAARRTHGRISSTRAWRTGPSSISIVVGTSYAASTSEPVARRVGAARVAREHAHAARRERAEPREAARGERSLVEDVAGEEHLDARERRADGVAAPELERDAVQRRVGPHGGLAERIDVEREHAPPRRRAAPRWRRARCRSRSPRRTARGRSPGGRARSARAPGRPPTGTPRTASRPSPRARRRSRATAASARSPGEPAISGASGTAAGAVRSRTNSMTSSSVRTGHGRDHAAWCAGNPGRRARPPRLTRRRLPFGHLVSRPACWRLTTRFHVDRHSIRALERRDRARIAPPSTCSDAPAFSRTAAPETARATCFPPRWSRTCSRIRAVVSRAIFEALAGARLRPVMVTGAHVECADAHAPSPPSRRAEGFDAG